MVWIGAGPGRSLDGIPDPLRGILIDVARWKERTRIKINGKAFVPPPQPSRSTWEQLGNRTAQIPGKTREEEKGKG